MESCQAKKRTERGSPLNEFAVRLFAEWRRLALPRVGARIVIAVSGGADSVALWLAFDELARKGRIEANAVVAHLDHGLRGAQSRADADWVEARAAELGYEFLRGAADVNRSASENKDNLEQAARQARYQFLFSVLRERGASYLLLAHTLDDQAETVLMRLLRGGGAQGLSAMRPVRRVDAEGFEQLGSSASVNDPLRRSSSLLERTENFRTENFGGEITDAGEMHNESIFIVRPLLSWARRAETEAYCRLRRVEARNDASNIDPTFTRVRVRTQLMPLLETFNPRVREALARTADLLHDDAAALDEYAAQLLCAAQIDGEPPTVSSNSTSPSKSSVSVLRVAVLTSAPAAIRRRALRLWLAAARGNLRRLDFAHIESIERLLIGKQGGRAIELPGGSRVLRCRGRIEFIRAN